MRSILAIGMLTLVAALPLTAMAQDAAWKPTGNVELVVGAEAGGAVDATARLIQKAMQDQHLVDVPVSVVNKPGSGQALAMAYIKQHEGDPNYLVLMSPSLVSTAIANGEPKPYADFTNLVKLFDGDLVVATGTDSGLNSIEDIATKLKADVTSVSFSFATSAGNPSHVALADFATRVGVDPRALRTVINGGSSDTLSQVAGGHVDIGVASYRSFLPMIQAGKVKVLGVFGAERIPGAPDVPTFREAGYDVVATAWYGIAGAPGLTAEQKKFWADTFAAAVNTDEIKQAAIENNWTGAPLGPDEFLAFLDQQWDSQHAALLALGLITQ